MILVLAAAASFASTPIPGSAITGTLGDATRQNFGAMIVPPPADRGALEGADGATATGAIRRLRDRKTPTLKNTTTSPLMVWER